MSDEKAAPSKILSPKMKTGLSVTGKGLLGLSIPAIVTALIAILPGILQDVRDQRAAQKAGYQTLSPAVTDLQNDVEKLRIWGAGVVTEHSKMQRIVRYLRKNNWKLEQRIYQIELALQARRIRVAPVSLTGPDGTPDMLSKPDSPVPLPVPKASPKRFVPKSLGGAKDYQRKRVQMKCPPGDPLCGG